MIDSMTFNAIMLIVLALLMMPKLLSRNTFNRKSFFIFLSMLYWPLILAGFFAHLTNIMIEGVAFTLMTSLAYFHDLAWERYRRHNNSLRRFI